MKAKGGEVAEDETVGWHHQLNGHESEQTLGDSEGQGSPACCLRVRVAKSQTRLINWTTATNSCSIKRRSKTKPSSFPSLFTECSMHVPLLHNSAQKILSIRHVRKTGICNGSCKEKKTAFFSFTVDTRSTQTIYWEAALSFRLGWIMLQNTQIQKSNRGSLLSCWLGFHCKSVSPDWLPFTSPLWQLSCQRRHRCPAASMCYMRHPSLLWVCYIIRRGMWYWFLKADI